MPIYYQIKKKYGVKHESDFWVALSLEYSEILYVVWNFWPLGRQIVCQKET